MSMSAQVSVCQKSSVSVESKESRLDPIPCSLVEKKGRGLEIPNGVSFVVAGVGIGVAGRSPTVKCPIC